MAFLQAKVDLAASADSRSFDRFTPLIISSLAGFSVLAIGFWTSVKLLRPHFGYLLLTAIIIVLGAIGWRNLATYLPLQLSDFYNIGVWQTLVATGIGLALSRVTYDRSNRARRLGSEISDWRPLVLAAVGGLLAAGLSSWLGGPDPAMPAPFDQPFLYVDIFGDGNQLLYPIAAPFALVIGVLVGWRFRAIPPTIVAMAGAGLAWLLAMSARGEANWDGIMGSQAPPWVIEVGSSALMGSIYGLTIMGVLSLLRPQLWNARLWLPGVVVSLIATLPHAAMRILFRGDVTLWWTFYVPWYTAMAIVIAYALVTPPVVVRVKDVWQQPAS